MTIYNEESRAKLSEKVPVKTREQKRTGGIIENWSLVPFYGDETKLVVVGTLHDDSQWGSGGPIRTSLILSINEDETEAETLNTIYKLGVKASA